jgi:hypothetical protein
LRSAQIGELRRPARLRKLRPIDLCPIVAGEKAPYASCVNKS